MNFLFYETGFQNPDNDIATQLKTELVKRGNNVGSRAHTFYQQWEPADFVVAVNLNSPVIFARIKGDALDNAKPFAELKNGKLMILDPKIGREIVCDPVDIFDLPSFYAKHLPSPNFPAPDLIQPPESENEQLRNEEEVKPKTKAKIRL